MKIRLPFAILLLITMTSALAAEDSQPVASTIGAATTDSVSTSQIVEPSKPLHFLLGAGLTFGGETLATMTYTDGRKDSITAGGLVMLYGGLDYRLDDAISLQGTLGYHVDSVTAANGEASFSRIPLELLAYYHYSDTIRFGGGIRYVNSPKIKGTGIAGNVNGSFDNTVGMIIEGEYLLDSTIGIKVRYVSETYQPTWIASTIDGSHIGVLANFYF